MFIFTEQRDHWRVTQHMEIVCCFLGTLLQKCYVLVDNHFGTLCINKFKADFSAYTVV